MLHIILTILKIIGWIILLILGILVLLICVVFFVPLCYKVEGSGEGALDSLQGRLKFSWLLHLVSGQALYSNGKFTWNIRIAWKRINNEPSYESESSPREFVEEPPKSVTKIESEHIEPEIVLDRQPESDASDTNREQTEKEQKKEPKEKQTKTKNLIRKLQEFFGKLKYTFIKICGTIKSLLEKKDKLTEFIDDETHKAAFSAILKELRRFFKLVKPRKWKAEVQFGFEDPSITGYVLALLSMIYPLVWDHTDIRPDFENQVFDGQIMATGKIRVFYVIIAVWNLIWNKRVRITYKHIREFKL